MRTTLENTWLRITYLFEDFRVWFRYYNEKNPIAMKAIIASVLLLIIALAFALLGTKNESIDRAAESSPSKTVSPPVNDTAPAPLATSPTTSSQQSNCDVNYSPCVPISSADIDCPDIGFSVRIIGQDIHRFDNDSDGYGCDRY